ncbi:hypothetical protein K435DRAFT_843739 [Dendrothele bispora CBS 962.96]|uniref:G-protein coupled receptors family 1 profile domain-containing protein n=1 Tax=Dendrothele bispora (strain CBS 962.96) TaxID=1314807 RepID=A0A4S8L707_DENBC|nr:hypothetical protein K435DRAFT_843739 [Dendrothele bispora CBS 962.96]
MSSGSPDTPHDGVRQLDIVFDIILAAVGMFIWDILINIPGDHKLLTKCRFRFPTAVYFFSRICCLAMLACGLLLGNIAADSSTKGNTFVNCQVTTEATKALFFLATSSTTFLFLVRARAIYAHSGTGQAILFLLWIVQVGTSTLDLFIVDGSSVPTQYQPLQRDLSQTKYYCILSNLRPEFAVISAVGILFYDTAIFFAISYRLTVINNADSGGSIYEKTVSFFSGRKLLVLSRMILLDGQIYYLISFILTALLLILLCVPSIGTAIRLITVLPHAVLVNALTCHVFRRVEFGCYQSREAFNSEQKFLQV